MKYADYERYKTLNPGDTESHWQAIENLLPHLDDRLLLVDEFEFYQISPCRLVAFTANDIPLYAIASDGGRVIVGKTESLGINTYLDLSDFDVQSCEVVTLTVSGQGDFASDYLSLWVCVHRYLPYLNATST